MTETPRTWILLGEHGAHTVLGPQLPPFHRIEVIEKAPVDAEREMMLDLLEGLLSARLDVAPTRHHDSVDQAIALLREYGRLGSADRALAIITRWRRGDE